MNVKSGGGACKGKTGWILKEFRPGPGRASPIASPKGLWHHGRALPRFGQLLPLTPTPPPESKSSTWCRTGPGALVVLGLFLALAVVGVVLKSHYEPLTLAERLRLGGIPLERGYLFGHDVSLPLSLRLGGALIYLAVESTISALGVLMMIGPETSWLFPGTPWEHKAYSAEMFAQVIVPLVAVHAYQVILLLPILLCALFLFRSFGIQVAYLALTMLCYGGWPPVAVNALFRVAGRFVDWPKAYYIFADRLIPSDVSILSFLFLLTLILARTSQLTWRTVIGFAALGQITAEHLGFVTGVAIFVTTLFAGGPIRRAHLGLATRHLATAGATSLILLLAISTFVIAAHGLPTEWQGDGSLSGALRAYSAYKWEKYGQYNFRWFNVIVANFITLMALPTLTGIVLGVVAGLRRSVADDDPVHRHFSAAVAVSFSFFLTMLLGLWNSGFASDMGRQALPLACLMVLVAAKGSQLLVIHLTEKAHRAGA